MTLPLRLHRLLPLSYANGPGARAVVWTQGCSRRCRGCFNPETHDPSGGRDVDASMLADSLLAMRDIEGVTLSGGEPLDQPEAVRELLARLREASGLSVVLMTGYGLAAARAIPERAAVLELVDVVLAGPYDDTAPRAGDPWRPAHKEVAFLTDRYTPADFDDVPPAEVIIAEDGSLVMTGVDPLRID